MLNFVDDFKNLTSLLFLIFLCLRSNDFNII